MKEIHIHKAYTKTPKSAVLFNTPGDSDEVIMDDM